MRCAGVSDAWLVLFVHNQWRECAGIEPPGDREAERMSGRIMSSFWSIYGMLINGVEVSTGPRASRRNSTSRERRYRTRRQPTFLFKLPVLFFAVLPVAPDKGLPQYCVFAKQNPSFITWRLNCGLSLNPSQNKKGAGFEPPPALSLCYDLHAWGSYGSFISSRLAAFSILFEMLNNTFLRGEWLPV